MSRIKERVMLKRALIALVFIIVFKAELALGSRLYPSPLLRGATDEERQQQAEKYCPSVCKYHGGWVPLRAYHNREQALRDSYGVMHYQTIASWCECND
jgi:hypothetical protein